jgi:hypothetical protein
LSNKYDETFGDLVVDLPAVYVPPAAPKKKPFDPKGLLSLTGELPDSQYVMQREVAEESALVRQQFLVDANETTLQIDIDDTETYTAFIMTKLPSLLKFTNVDGAIYGLRVKKVLVTESRSFAKKGSRHVYIHVTRALSIPERIALQAVLGSDSTREMLNIMAFLDGLSNGVMLFENQDAKPEVIFDAEPTTTQDLASVLLG